MIIVNEEEVMETATRQRSWLKAGAGPRLGLQRRFAGLGVGAAAAGDLQLRRQRRRRRRSRRVHLLLRRAALRRLSRRVARHHVLHPAQERPAVESRVDDRGLHQNNKV